MRFFLAERCVVIKTRKNNKKNGEVRFRYHATQRAVRFLLQLLTSTISSHSQQPQEI